MLLGLLVWGGFLCFGNRKGKQETQNLVLWFTNFSVSLSGALFREGYVDGITLYFLVLECSIWICECCESGSNFG